METKPYRIKAGHAVNHNSEIRRAGDVIELTEMQATDPYVSGHVEPLPTPEVPAPQEPGPPDVAPANE